MKEQKMNNQVVGFVTNHGDVRHLFLNKQTLLPSLSVSLYEAFLQGKTTSFKTVKSELDCLNHLFTWADTYQIPLERELLSGQPLLTSDIRSFAASLGDLVDDSIISVNRYNRILLAASTLICWYYSQYGGKGRFGADHHITVKNVTENIKAIFKSHLKKTNEKMIARDLSDDEIAIINNYLKPGSRNGISIETSIRDFLCWRLLIEFGIREGELLALMLDHLPYGDNKYIKIVRIEDRGPDYSDPRGTYAPRPKTLGRNLGFIFKDTPLPHLINEYTTKHRYRIIERNGKKVRDWDLGHDFLIINHRDGMPLSVSSLQDLAKEIRIQTGIDFNWHVTRHAFFNRAYAAVMHNPEMTKRKMDLVVWGGWKSEDSLNIYANRALEKASEKALFFWQAGINEWEALK